jgi:hypothetical protein
MEQGYSWEADVHSDSQEISHFLWNLKVYCRVRGRPPLVPVLGHMNPVHGPRVPNLSP